MNRFVLAATLSLLALTAAAHAQAPAGASSTPAAPSSAAPVTAPAPKAPAGPATAGSPAGRLLDRLLVGITLRPEQTAAIEKLRAQFEDSSAALRADLRTRAAELRRMRGAGGGDAAALESKRAEFQTQQAKLKAEADKLAAQVSELLDPEQRTAFERAREEMRADPQLQRRPPVGAPPASAGAATPPPAQG